jgi:hypothetical protein
VGPEGDHLAAAWYRDSSCCPFKNLALGTQWYILFNVIAGASAFPVDISAALGAVYSWGQFQTLIGPRIVMTFNQRLLGGLSRYRCANCFQSAFRAVV